jgi:hypothetical protein
MWSAAEIRGEAVYQESDQRPVAQPDDRRHIDAVEELLGLVAVEHRRLALFDDVLGPAHGRGRVLFDDLADDQRVEQHAQCCEVLLDGRAR